MSKHGDSNLKGYVISVYEIVREKEREEVVCEVFGCPEKLSLMEQLCGSKCIHHSKKEKQLYHNGKL